MRIKFYKIFSSIALLLLVLVSCKKDTDNIFNLFDGLKVDYKSSLAADEVYVEFALAKTASGANMAKVTVTETGSTTPVYTTPINFTNRFSYQSGVITLKASNPQSLAYTVKVYDDANNDITSQVTVTYPSGKLIEKSPVLIKDGEVSTFAENSTVYIDYTITSSDKDINSVVFESFSSGLSVPTRITVATVPVNSDKKTFRGVVRTVLNRDGEARFRVYAQDASDNYIGDGYKTINTNVNAGFELSANKFIYALDSNATTQNPDVTTASFYSIAKKKTYSYTEGKANSADIDFGIVLTKTNNASIPFNLNFYAISAGPSLVSFLKFDFSGWTTKRTTKFSPAIGQYLNPDNTSTPANTLFADGLTSGFAINSLIGLSANYKNTLIRTTVTITPGNMFFFVTPEGKYGAVFINGFGKDYLGRYYANIDVKYQK